MKSSFINIKLTSIIQLLILLFLNKHVAYGVNTQKVREDSVDTSSSQLSTPQTDWFGGLILPKTRQGTSFNASSETQICGGILTGNAHYMTGQEIQNKFQWYIRTPFADSTCQLRISTVYADLQESNFAVLYPDSSSDVAPDGTFPCGRTGPITETRTFTFGNNISCDHCVLEWVWNTPLGTARQCADIMITSGKDTPCLGMCQNNGVCSNGKCICPKGYAGEYCQKSPWLNFSFSPNWVKVFVVIFWLIFTLACIAGLFVGLYYFAKKRLEISQQNQIYHTNINFSQNAPGMTRGGYIEFDKDHVENIRERSNRDIGIGGNR